MDNKIKNLSTNQTYMIVHGQLSGKGTRPDFSYEEFNSELLCIKMNLGKNSELFVFSLYNPPNVLLNIEFFKTCRNYISGGDLNARTKQIGCVGENENGIMLERIINELDFSKIYKTSLPPNIVNLIKERRKNKKRIKYNS
ncbi:hypothetical protein BpHYR1_012227 [Brachionus plicatilis]|uniref:RNA-directed DNA polymerase from mobile element jockey-like n=1 Tax=Brachionus plicatilis TaxID=10195 RepID=A0A3M7R235_BRAPC|nr:hypothetical protein BpHYR1_012227 [Brachionus plicatilis]